MPQIINCPSCSQRYQMADSHVGTQVRCPQCGHQFTALPTAGLDTTSSAGQGYGVSSTTTGPQSPNAPNPLGSPTGSYASSPTKLQHGGITNPSGGPTDPQMRLAAAGMLALGVVMLVGSIALNAATGSVYMMVVGLTPLMLVLGAAGLISPNSVRAVGKYGGHLPLHYKMIGWALIGVSLFLPVVVMVGLFVAGYQTDVPRPKRRARAPGLPRIAPRVPASQPKTSRPPAVAGSGGQPGAETSKGPKTRKAYPISIAIPANSALVPPEAKLPPGTKLEACWAGKWNPITLLSDNEDGSLNVRWDDFGPSFDCSMVRSELIVRRNLLTQMGIPVPAHSTVSEARPPATLQKPLKDYPVTIAVPAGSQLVPANAKLPPGTRLQACWSDKWNPITLLAENADGTLTVRWDDFGAAFDCSMRRQELIIDNDTLGRVGR